jgi:hypothetical protein
MILNENTIFFYEGSYQYNALVVLDTTLNNLYAGVINKLVEQYTYRPTKETLWADIKSQEGVLRATVTLENGSIKVGIPESGSLEWYTPSLLEPTYELNTIARL